jgi:hypothetical protein
MASDGFGLAGIRRILELENHVAALQAELADERRRTTGERPKARD